MNKVLVDIGLSHICQGIRLSDLAYYTTGKRKGLLKGTLSLSAGGILLSLAVWRTACWRKQKWEVDLSSGVPQHHAQGKGTEMAHKEGLI